MSKPGVSHLPVVEPQCDIYSSVRESYWDRCRRHAHLHVILTKLVGHDSLEVVHFVNLSLELQMDKW